MRSMSEMGTFLAVIYVAGVTLGLIVIDAHPSVRIGLALLWPIGPIAFVVTLTVLLIASLIAFPAFGAAVLAIGALVWIVSQ